jgi:autotransporter-associated beta strand protein
LNFNGGTLENTASFTSSRDINANGAVNIVTDAGTTLTDTAGSITGSGPINKGGTGTLVLGADNSTGGINIGAGTLQLAGASTDTGATNIAAGATLAITGNGSDASASSINNGGTLDISGANGTQSIGSLAGNGAVNLGNNGLSLTNANGNFSGTIGGNGGVTMSGGTEVLSGSNTYTGGTTLNGGNLVVNSDANLGAAGTPVTFNGGTLTVTQSINTSRNLVINSGGANFNTLGGVTVQDSGAISGSGGLVKSGDGTLVVSGANTFSGGTLIDGGVVQIDSGSSLGTGTILLNGGTLQTTASLNNNQNVVATGNAGVNVNTGTTTLMAGNVQEASGGGCFVKSGGGTLDFTGTEVLANGTCVQQGMLRANGNLVSNVTVDAAGELRGVGVVNGPINVSGRLAPGNSPGTLAATGTVTMLSGSTYEEDIDGLGTGTGAGNYSRLLISGANSQFIANGTLMPLLRGITGNASNTYVPQIGDVYQFVVAQGGIVGQFSALTQPDGLAPNTRMVAFYNVDDNHSIELGVVPDSYASLIAGDHANRNALSLAGALDKALDLQASGTASTGQSQLLFALADAKAGQLAGVLTNLSGEVYADEAAAARATGLALQSDTLGHLITDDSDANAEQKGHTAWSNVSHTGNSWNGDAQGSAFQTGTNQTTAGSDLYAGNGTVVGVAVSNHDNAVNAGAAQGTIRGYDGIVYGQQAIASVLVDGMVAQGHDTWITRRPDPTGAGDLYSRASGNNTMADLTARLPMTVGGMHVEPYASVTWQQFDRGGMSETASSPAALQVAHLSASGGRALLGLNIGSEQQDPLSSEVTYRVGAALGADSRGMLSPTVQATIENETFQTKAATIGSGFVQVQANGTLRLSHDAYLYGGLTDENGARRSSYGVTAGVRVSF